MQAYAYTSYGSPERISKQSLEDIQNIPKGHSLIRVKAVGANPIDAKVRSGAMRWIFPMFGQKIPGVDFAGTLSATHPEEKNWKLGDPVMGLLPLSKNGSCSEQLLVKNQHLVKIPEGLSMEQAASLPCAGLTAYKALFQLGNLQAKQRVLICGASGGVGSLAVLLARHAGAKVSAICSQANEAYVRQLGAHQVHAYDGDFQLEGPYDLIFDVVSFYPYRAMLPYLQEKGCYVNTLPKPQYLFQALIRGQKLPKTCMVKPDPKALEKIALDFSKEQWPLAIQSFPMKAIASVHHQLESQRTKGKIVLVWEDKG